MTWPVWGHEHEEKGTGMETRRLYRSEQDRMVAGICGGLGAYLGIDPTVVRVVFVVLGLLSGVGLVLYLVMWIVVPTQSRLDAPPPDVAREGVADIRDRARQGVQEARHAVQRVRGRRQQPEAGAAGAPAPEPGAAGAPAPEPELGREGPGTAGEERPPGA